MTSGSFTASAITIANGGIADFAGSSVNATVSGHIAVTGATSQFKVDQGAIVSAASLSNTGQLTLGSNADLIVFSSVLSSGTITLSGGELDIRGSLTNSLASTIQGFGTLSTTTGLINNGIIQFSAQSQIQGPITNAATGTIEVPGLVPSVFFGPVANSGIISIDPAGNATFNAPLTGSGQIINNGSLAINATSTIAQITGNTGDLTIGTPISPATLRLNFDATAPQGPASTVASLNINTGSQLNLTNNILVINYASPAADPVAQVCADLTAAYAAQYAGANLLITNSTAAASPGKFVLGYTDNTATNQLTIEFTLPGDANLDGTVNFNDLLVIAQHFGQSAAKGNPVSWTTGDVSFDNQVNFSDLLIVAQNFGNSLTKAQSTELPASFLAQYNLALTELAASDASTTSVPEPASAGLLAIAALGFLSLRRRTPLTKI